MHTFHSSRKKRIARHRRLRRDMTNLPPVLGWSVFARIIAQRAQTKGGWRNNLSDRIRSRIVVKVVLGESERSNSGSSQNFRPSAPAPLCRPSNSFLPSYSLLPSYCHSTPQLHITHTFSSKLRSKICIGVRRQRCSQAEKQPTSASPADPRSTPLANVLVVI